MALILNGEKLKVNVNGEPCNFLVHTILQVLNNANLLSSEGYVLKSSNALYLTVKEEK